MSAHYRCLYYNALGRTESAVLPAESEAELVRSFDASGKTLVSVEPVRTLASGGAKRKKNRDAVLQFTEMLDILLDSGLTLKEALDVASSAGGGNGTADLASRLLESVGKGSSFSRAVESMPEVFPPIYRGMIRVGERVGSVERIFPRLSAYLRDRKALGDKIAGALVYPAFVLAVALLGTAGMAVFVLPRMEEIFAGFGGGAATSVRSNLAALKAVLAGVFSALALGSAAIWAARLAGRRDPSFAARLDRALLVMPVVGPFVSAWDTLSFAFAMETLSSGGVPVEDAIEEASFVVGNAAYREALIEARGELLKGTSVSRAFASRREFPEYLRQWMSIGERSGKTERIFSQIRAFYQADVDRRAARFMTLVEPALIAFIGAFLMILVVGIVIPLFSMYGSML